MAGEQILTGEVVVIWDAITKPETKEDGGVSHGVTVAIHPDSEHLPQIQAIYEQALLESKWKGKLPKGGNNPIGEVDEEKIPELAGWFKFAAGTRRGCPAVFDKHNADLPPMQFTKSFYAGSKVELLIDTYAYDNVQKGIAFGLLGIKVLDNKAPALAVSGGISADDARAAFGGSSAKPSATGGAKRMTDTATNTYEEYIEGGWDDAGLIEAGFMHPPAKAAPPAPGKPKPPAPGAKPGAPKPPAPKPSAPTKPNAAILAGKPAGPVMTDAATFTYEEYIEAGYDDAGLIAEGLMVAPSAKPKPPAPGKPKPPAPKPKAAGPVMTDAAGGISYEDYIGEGWDDAGLIAAGFMEAA